jgi:hypothetical protein
MESEPKNPIWRVLCVSLFAALFAFVPLSGYGHVHQMADATAFDSASASHPSGSLCLICRLAQDRAVNETPDEASTPLTLAGSAESPSTLWLDRGSAGPLTSRGPPSFS